MNITNAYFNCETEPDNAIESGFSENDIETLLTSDMLSREEMRENFISAIEELEKHGFFNDVPDSAIAETEFRFKTDEIPNTEFDGRIDIITEKDGQYSLFDYKTGMQNREMLSHYVSENGVSFKTKTGKGNPENLKKEYGLNYSVRPVLKISGTAALITLCIGFNTGALLIFLGVLLRRRDFSVGVMVSFIVILVSGFCLLLYGYDHAVSRNVISVESAALLKIPKTYSADLLAVSEGTVLNVLGESGNFLIVRNDLGITGWIEKTKVRPDF